MRDEDCFASVYHILLVRLQIPDTRDGSRNLVESGVDGYCLGIDVLRLDGDGLNRLRGG